MNVLASKIVPRLYLSVGLVCLCLAAGCFLQTHGLAVPRYVEGLEGIYALEADPEQQIRLEHDTSGAVHGFAYGLGFPRTTVFIGILSQDNLAVLSVSDLFRYEPADLDASILTDAVSARIMFAPANPVTVITYRVWLPTGRTEYVLHRVEADDE
jgi:hypothetical protein